MRTLGVVVGEGTAPRSRARRACTGALLASLGEADVVVLTCPLTAETEGLIGEVAFAAMKRSAVLVNVARGRVVDEDALIAALASGALSAAALDCVRDEPLPSSSPLWDFDNVLITSHNAGDSRRYEDGVVDILIENLARLSRGETELFNQTV